MTDKPKNINEETVLRSSGATSNSFADGLTSFGTKLKDNFVAATGLGSSIARLQGILNPGGNQDTTPEAKIQFFGITQGRYGKDPRVKIKIPSQYLQGPARHLADVGDDAVVFPYTPQIVVQTRANYNALTPTHSNYAFYAYQNSQLDAISIVGTFTAQNLNDANYMMASIHALRSVTKMNFGGSRDPGAPPPVCRLDGYGTYQFNDMPVVISSFFYTLNEDVDYLTATPGFDKKTAVPTRAEFTIECLPAFSRRDQASFSIDKFISGESTENKGMI
jgi:hypothetical protein